MQKLFLIRVLFFYNYYSNNNYYFYKNNDLNEDEICQNVLLKKLNI